MSAGSEERMAVDSRITPEVRALFYRYDRSLPLEAEETVHDELGGPRRVHFRIASTRGERVPGHLWLPPGAGPHPAVILQHGAGSSKEDASIARPAARWARNGYATAAIDAHLHGERRRDDAPEGSVWSYPWRRRDHAVQMAVDLMRTVDYLAARPDIDPSRIGFAGFSMGTIMGVPFVALERRVRAAVFCIGGSLMGQAAGHPGPAEAERLAAEVTDPVFFAPLIAPRPVLMINGLRDEVVPPAAAEALYDALGEPKEIVWFEGGHTDLSGVLFKRMWDFLRATV